LRREPAAISMRAVVSYKELPQVLASRAARLLRRSQCQTPGGASAALADGKGGGDERTGRLPCVRFKAVRQVGIGLFGEMSADGRVASCIAPDIALMLI